MTRWTRTQVNAMHALYDANWRWSAIATHVSAIGPERTVKACIRKAQDCGITLPERNVTALEITTYDDDLRDMMLLDYSQAQMCRELSAQYGRHLAVSTINNRLKKIGGYDYLSWQKRAKKRRSASIWEARRAAA